MPTLTFRSKIDAPAEAVFAWHGRPGALERLSPPWAPAEVKQHDGIRDGNRAVLRVPFGPARLTWVAEHRDYEEGRQFRDVQVKGPFEKWEHTHRVEPAGPEACILEDHIEYALPLGKLGAELGEDQVRKQLERQFAYRHRVVRQDVPAHLKYAAGRTLRVAVSGASGLIGSNLTAFLRSGGHKVVPLVRKPPAKGEQAIYWNHREGEIEADKLEGFDAFIHLAGEPVFVLRWSESKKTRIFTSRVRGTELVAKTLAKLKNPPRVFLSASGTNYYGHSGQTELTEESPPGDRGFMCALVQEWEAATRPAADAGIRTVRMRTGAVLSPEGGALDMMLPVFRLGLGGNLGGEDPYLSWIALDDYLHALYHVLWTETLEGPVNVTSPNPVPLGQFTKTLAKVIHRPLFLTIPAGLLKLASGEIAEEMVLTSLRVLPQRLLDSGYTFLYPGLEQALRHELGYEHLKPTTAGE